MTREELLRVLTFVDTTRALSEKRTKLAAVDPRWNIISYAMRRHLEGKLLTITSAAMAADVPYGTALRRINELIESGFLIKRAKSKTGKSFSMHPSRKLIEEVESYAMQLKATVGGTFGFNTDNGSIDDFYFGGSYMASRILPYPTAMRSGVGYDHTIRILSPSDPTFKTLSDFSSNLDGMCGTNVEIVNLGLDDLYREIMTNAQGSKPKYDLVAIDLPWVGQLAEEGAIEPLDRFIQADRYNPSDFHSAAYNGSSWRDAQYGLPIQPTAELLFCRQDLFDQAGLSIPKTTEDVLFAARMLHRSSFNMAGIVMNFGRGTPVAHTFIQTMADFGHPVINLASLGPDFDVKNIVGEQFRPLVDSDAGRRTAEFLCKPPQLCAPRQHALQLGQTHPYLCKRSRRYDLWLEYSRRGFRTGRRVASAWKNQLYLTSGATGSAVSFHQSAAFHWRCLQVCPLNDRDDPGKSWSI